jgi:hypothetical protein
MEVYIHAFLTLALDGDDWSASSPNRSAARWNLPSSHGVGGRVGPTVCRVALPKRRKVLTLPWIKARLLDCVALSPVTIPSELSRLGWRETQGGTREGESLLLWTFGGGGGGGSSHGTPLCDLTVVRSKLELYIWTPTYQLVKNCHI